MQGYFVKLQANHGKGFRLVKSLLGESFQIEIKAPGNPRTLTLLIHKEEGEREDEKEEEEKGLSSQSQCQVTQSQLSKTQFFTEKEDSMHIYIAYHS